MPKSRINAANVQTAAMATKEGVEVGLFSFFTKMETFAWFTSHVLRFIFFPLIGLVFLTNAIIESYKLYKANNKNAESVASMVAAYGVAGLAIASITGTLLASVGVLATEFVLGPFLFIGALGTGFLHQFGMGIINTIRFFQAPKGSEERQGYKQAIFQNAYHMLLLGAVATMITLLMISPAGPAVLAGVAGTAVALTAINFAWKLIPQGLKNNIKSFFGFAKPTIDIKPARTNTLSTGLEASKEITLPSQSSKGLFTASFRKHKVIKLINEQGLEVAKSYLLKQIEAKQTTLSAIQPADTKTLSKLSVLEHMKSVINDDDSSLQSVSQLAKSHQKAFQSFFAKVSDTEDLYKAVDTYVQTRQTEKTSTLNMSV